ncbi:hypothetical protein HAX54_000929 [Datura stramonium]|uniref:3'-5' exonuclease domain-containing protein n=1 Tax=Datura stramonium TaxID=4076 RepID=A0ABS8WST7_DATST|nr:hypothetical protein [Datura stramonium]
MDSSYGSTSSGTASKYNIKFGGQTIETTVTDKAAVANEWASAMLSKYSGKQTVVGLDNEWKPTFSPYTSNKSATLQLCIDNTCLIVQLFYLDEIPQTLKKFLANPNFIFVGVEVAEDILKLKNEYGLVCASMADVGVLAKNKWPGRYSRPGLKDLAYEICGLLMAKPKHVCQSNWEARVLTNGDLHRIPRFIFIVTALPDEPYSALGVGNVPRHPLTITKVINYVLRTRFSLSKRPRSLLFFLLSQTPTLHEIHFHGRILPMLSPSI